MARRPQGGDADGTGEHPSEGPAGLRSPGRRANSHRARPSIFEHLAIWIALGALSCAVLATVVVSASDSLEPSSLITAVTGDSSDSPAAGPSTAASSSAAPSATPEASTTSPPAPQKTATSTPLKPQLPTVAEMDEVMAGRGKTRIDPSAWEHASFTVASFNVLGASHTRGKHRRKNFAGAEQRISPQFEMLAARGVSVAGLQEFQSPQVNMLAARLGGTYDVFPGVSLGARLADNSIVWRTEDWEAVQKETVGIPYFHGHLVDMPYVLLRHRQSGRTVWFANFHNPANVAGDAKRWRQQALAIEADLATRLGADGTPVIFTGDMNDRAEFACPFAQASGMVSADGATYRDGQCYTPRRMNVDWIFGSEPVAFDGFVADDSTINRRLSDHPMITATVGLAGVEQRPGCVPRLVRRGVVWYCPA